MGILTSLGIAYALAFVFLIAVLFKGNIMPGSSDPGVLAYACKDGRIQITDDKDFGELVFRL